MAASLVSLSLACAGAGRSQAGGSPPTDASVNGAWQLQSASLVPQASDAMACAYDPVRRLFWMFGGYDGSAALNGLWALNLDGVPQWSVATALGMPPPARLTHTMIYDPVRDRMIVFGGSPNGTTALGDVWALSLAGAPTWSQLAVVGTGPSLYEHCAIYDPVRDRMLVYGGKTAGPISGDVWALSLADPPTWSLVAAGGTTPSGRYFASAIYDPVGDRMVVFGGNVDLGGGNIGMTSDAWALSLAGAPAWTLLSTTGLPPQARRSHGAVYDATLGRMVVYGGVNGVHTFEDAYALTLDATPTWTNVTPFGSGPPPRSSFAIMFDPLFDRAIIYGGVQQSTLLGDTWAYNLAAPTTWTALGGTASGPGNRLVDASCYDSKRRAMDLFGGKDNVGFRGDMWTLPLTPSFHWTQADFQSTAHPGGREVPALVYDSVDDRIVMFGGADATHVYKDTWLFDPSTGQWTQLAVPGAPPSSVKGMAFVYDPLRNRLIEFGGWTGSQPIAELWALTLGASPHWDQIFTSGASPSPRFSAAMVYDAPHDRLVMFGGYNNSGPFFGDIWALNLTGTPAWTQYANIGSGPGAREAMLAVFDSPRDRMVVFGGYNGVALNDVYTLNLAAGGGPTWSTLLPDGPSPSPRDFMAGVYDPIADRLVVYGGNAMVPPPGTGLTGANDLWTLTWGDQATPTLLAFGDERTGAGTVRLTWFTPDGAGQRAVAQRGTDGVSWEDIAQLTSDASGDFVLVDSAPAGGRFDYRLGVQGASGEEFTEDHWVVIPAGVAFGIASTGANPSRGALRVDFALAGTGPASLDLYDVAGRRVVHKDLAALGAGPHTLDLAADRRLASGLYVVRLSQGRRAVERKVAVLR